MTNYDVLLSITPEKAIEINNDIIMKNTLKKSGSYIIQEDGVILVYKEEYLKVIGDLIKVHAFARSQGLIRE